ncbi:MAG: hypothetical protein LAN18_03640 [Acidobacteriia bacterium]|nr:hypothetical protein [Terriglobia bacterium]
MPEYENSRRVPFQFEEPRQERIFRRLKLVGDGPAEFYRDACRLMSQESDFASTTHLVAHLLREIESGLRQILETVADQSLRLKKGAKNEEKHTDKIRAVLKGLEIAEIDPVAEVWLRLPGRDNNYGLAARAHRDDLSAPRTLDGEFKEFWNLSHSDRL